MFTTEEKVLKNIVTPEGEDTFQIRYIPDEEVGILTTPSEKSYFILDSSEYWFDLIQEKYPPKKKCQCKNDLYHVCFNYIPRIGTDDYKAIELVSCCTACGKQRKFAEISIKYSPTSQLFEQPITFCEQPKIKYKTYSIGGFWQDDTFLELIDFLSQKCPTIYCLYWNQTEKRREVKRCTIKELKQLLADEGARYLAIYFSSESLEADFSHLLSDDKGPCIDRNIWRKKNVAVLYGPFCVVGKGYYYSMEFCSEYLDTDGKVKEKDLPFCEIVRELLAYHKEHLK